MSSFFEVQVGKQKVRKHSDLSKVFQDSDLAFFPCGTYSVQAPHYEDCWVD